MVGDTFPQNNEVKQQLNVQNRLEGISINDLRNIVSLKFSNDTEFAKNMDWSRVTACRLLTGDWIPQDPKVIHKLARVLNLDVIKLVRLFDNYNNPEIIRADKYKVSEHASVAPEASTTSEVKE